MIESFKNLSVRTHSFLGFCACLFLMSYALYAEHILDLEPCPMCASAISFARLTSIIFSAEDKKSGGILNGPKIYNSSSCHHKPSVIRIDDKGRSKKLLQKFFQDKRKNKTN